MFRATKSFHTMFGNSDIRVHGKVKESVRLREMIKHIDDLNTRTFNLRQKTNGSLNQRIQEKLRAEWIYNSNAIEGSRLTLGDTIFFLQEGLTVQGKPLKDFLDAQNHAEAIDYLQEVIRDEGREIDAPLIKQINSLLLKGVERAPAVDPFGNMVMRKSYPGHYKKHPNQVFTLTGEIYNFVAPSDVKMQMDDLFSWVNEKLATKCLHPLIVSAMAHYNMVHIHPFDDGNGRGARILMNLILMKSKLQVAIIKNEDRNEYLQLLNEANKSGELEPFTVFIGNSLIKTQEMILEQVNKYICDYVPESKPRGPQ